MTIGLKWFKVSTLEGFGRRTTLFEFVLGSSLLDVKKSMTAYQTSSLMIDQNSWNKNPRHPSGPGELSLLRLKTTSLISAQEMII